MILFFKKMVNPNILDPNLELLPNDVVEGPADDAVLVRHLGQAGGEQVDVGGEVVQLAKGRGKKIYRGTFYAMSS